MRITGYQVLIAKDGSGYLPSFGIVDLRYRGRKTARTTFFSISLGHSKLRIMEFVSFKPPSVIVELAVSQCQFPAFTLVRNAERQYSYHLISNIAYTAPGTSPVRIPIRKNGLRKIYHPPAFRQRPATGLYIAADRLPGKPCPGKFLQTVLGIAAGQIEQIRLLRNSPVLLRIEKRDRAHTAQNIQMLRIEEGKGLFVARYRDM